MNVIVTSTPEVSKELLNEVVKVLQSTPGIISFSKGDTLSKKQFSLINDKFKDEEIIVPFSFDELFGLVDGYRDFKEKEIDNQTYVVLLTNIRNNDNWFSAFRGNNIFVDCNNWHIFTNKHPKFSITHQIVENIFQSLVNLKIEGDLDPLIHMPPEGCINDMCDNKRDIKWKFMTARICPVCLKVARKKIQDPLIINQIKRFLNNLRDEFMKEEDDIDEYLPPITVSEKGDIKIGNLDFHLEEVPRSIYLFFLKNQEGVKTKEVFEKAEDIYLIYKKIKKAPNKVSIANAFGYKLKGNRLINRNHVNDQFGPIKSKITAKIKSVLGSELLKHYSIINDTKDDDNYYLIKLSPSLITLPPELA